MEEALKQWNSVFDDDSFNIWHNSPSKVALIQVMFHNLMKQLQILQKTTNEIFIEKGTTNLPQNDFNINNRTPIKGTPYEHVTEVQPKENVHISDVDSPDIFKDNSILSSANINTSDSILNRNVLDIESPVPDLVNVVLPSFTSPTINRRKPCKKKKLSYPELNTTEKSMIQDTISATTSQTSLIDFNKKCTLMTNDTSSEIKSIHQETIPHCSPQSSSGQHKTFKLPNLSRIRKRLQNLNTFSPNETIDLQTDVKRLEADKDDTLTLEDANTSSDATVLLSCPTARNIRLPSNSDDSFLILPKERTTKPIFLSKWEQQKLLENDADEQNCSRCGNFRGFQDLSPTMCATKDYKCPKHRKKYIRINTPEAIWNLDFPDEDGE